MIMQFDILSSPIKSQKFKRHYTFHRLENRSFVYILVFFGWHLIVLSQQKLERRLRPFRKIYQQ